MSAIQHRPPRTPAAVVVRVAASPATLGLLLVAAALLACRGGSASECGATLEYEGKTVPGKGANQIEARQGACWKYCGEHDRAVEEAYTRFKASGAKSQGDRFADLNGTPSLKQVLEACEARCSADIDRSKAKVTYRGCQ